MSAEARAGEMAAKGSSNSQLLSQLNSCLKELLATESGPEDPQLCARTRDALLALMQACPGAPASYALAGSEHSLHWPSVHSR